jgi:hypothetical protein
MPRQVASHPVVEIAANCHSCRASGPLVRASRNPLAHNLGVFNETYAKAGWDMSGPHPLCPACKKVA